MMKRQGMGEGWRALGLAALMAILLAASGYCADQPPAAAKADPAAQTPAAQNPPAGCPMAKAGCAACVSVRAAGAAADGNTDDTPVFQRLLDEAGKAGGGVVCVPAGQYAIRGNLRIPAHVTLRGISAFAPVPSHATGTPARFDGSVLLAYAGRGSQQGAPFIQLAGANAAVEGLTVFYPEVRREELPPVPYPPCILASGSVENTAVIDCQLINPYEGIRLEEAHRFLIRNVMGYPIWRGLYVGFCADIGRVENVHYWPFNVTYKPDDPYCAWINKNGTAFEFARTDWQYVTHTFCFGYGVGYKFTDQGKGGTNGSFVGIGADCCQEAVRVEKIQPYGLQIVNGEFVGRWSSTDAVTFNIAEGAEGKVSLVNCNFWGPIDRCLWLRAPGAQLTAMGCNFFSWDMRKSGSPALQLDAGKAILQGNTFGEGRRQIAVGAKVKSAIVTANQGVQGVEIVNQAGKRLQASLNEPFADAAKK